MISDSASAGDCPQCVNPSSGQKEFDTVSLNKNDLAMSKCEYSSLNDALSVEWEGGNQPSHTSIFTPRQLNHLAADGHANVQDAQPWKAKTVAEAYDRGEISASLQDYLSSVETFQKVLIALNRYGLAFITDIPKDESAVEQIGEKIGPLRHTFYGRTWDVKDKPNAENVAYTATELGLHMDLLSVPALMPFYLLLADRHRYMKQPPGLQLLHCINASSDGGKSFFSDAFAAADDLYRSGGKGRKHFQTLTKYPVRYHYNQPKNAFFDEKTVFETTSSSLTNRSMQVCS